MGIVRPGPPVELVRELRDACGIRRFIETGTYIGETAYWASQEFEQVITIERAESLHIKAARKYSHLENIRFICGDSREILRNVLRNLDGASMFWLDAHWSGGETHGESKECPLIGELETVSANNLGDCILIDDARLFLSPPPPPHRFEQWPDISTVVNALAVGNRKYVVVVDDVVIAVPEAVKPIVVQYCQEVNRELWHRYLQGFTRIEGWPKRFRRGVGRWIRK